MQAYCLKIPLSLSYLLLVFSGFSQDSAMHKPKLQKRLYVDAYYSYEFNAKNNPQKSSFLFNHNRLNAVNVNLALAVLTYNETSKRAALGLMAGTYATYNLAAEPTWLQHVYEANMGIKLSARKNLWIDAGIMPSHIGFESAISKECATLTRSILAENSPYYEFGVKLSYTATNEKWYAALLMLNGWQRISPIFKNNRPALGTQITYTSLAGFKFNWSSFVGAEKMDSTETSRFFNNFYGIWQLGNRWSMIIGFDYGIQRNKMQSGKTEHWFSPVAIVRYEKDKFAIALRSEYYNDKNGVITPQANAAAVNMLGYSINADRKLGKYVLCRIEWRLLNNSSPYFESNNTFRRSSQSFTGSLVLDIAR